MSRLAQSHVASLPAYRPSASLAALILTVAITLPHLFTHLDEALSPREMGAVDEGRVVDSVHVLANDLTYDVETHSIGHFYYLLNAVLLRILHYTADLPLTFENVALFLRVENVLLLYLCLLLMCLIAKHLNLPLCPPDDYISAVTLFVMVSAIYFTTSATLVIRAKPDFLVSGFSVVGFYLLLRAFNERKRSLLLLAAVFIGLAVQVKLTGFLHVLILGIACVFYGPRTIPLPGRTIAPYVPYLVLASIFPVLWITDSFNAPYSKADTELLHAMAVGASAVAVPAALLHHVLKGGKGAIGGREGWAARIHVGLLFLGACYLVHVLTTVGLSIGNRYGSRAFVEPVARAVFNGLRRVAHVPASHRYGRFVSVLGSELTVPVAALLLVSALVFSVVLVRNHATYRYSAMPVLGISLALVAVLVGSVNELDFRYAHPYLHYMVCALTVVTALEVQRVGSKVVRRAGLLLMCGSVLLVIQRHPIFGAQLYATETDVRSSSEIAEFLRRSSYATDTEIFAEKMYVIPGAYQRVRIIGESNASYYFSDKNFERPDWRTEPGLVILSQRTRDRISDGRESVVLRRLAEISKVPRNGRVSFTDPYVDPDALHINVDQRYVLLKTINDEAFIYGRARSEATGARPP